MSSARLYRGHRSKSFNAGDINELVELRARQRTFHGAYSRTALGNLGYAATILRLFDKRFYRIGLLFGVLAGLLYVISFFRARHSRHDFADYSKEGHMDRQGSKGREVIKTAGADGTRIFGRPFDTAGRIVVAVSVIVLTIEIALLILVLEM